MSSSRVTSSIFTDTSKLFTTEDTKGTKEGLTFLYYDVDILLSDASPCPPVSSVVKGC